jgi:hypothetical protein
MDKLKALDRILILSLLVALGGCAVMEGAMQSNSDIPLFSYCLLVMGFAGATVSYFVKRRIVPLNIRREEQKTNDEWTTRGVIIDFDTGPFIFLSGFVAESSAFYFALGPLYGIIGGIVYFGIAYFIFLKYRKCVTSFKWDYFFHGAIVLAIPTTSFVLVYPEFLYSGGIVSISGSSREFSILTIIFLQVGLIISTVIAASRSWRTVFLKKRKYDIKGLQALQANTLAAIIDEKKRIPLREIFSDIAVMREALILGHFDLAVTFGWSIIERALGKLSKERSPRKKAKDLGVPAENFEKCYAIRNKTVHAGYKPNLDDAFECLQMVRNIVMTCDQLKNEPLLETEKEKEDLP